MKFPEGKRFAFTILDDTDDATLENIRPVYERLRDLGLRTTKTAWPMECPEGSKNYFAADTLQRSEYLAFVKDLVRDGFELASHGATMEGSLRARTEEGLAFLDREFGSVPRLHANHGENGENLYWGFERFQSPLVRALVRLIGRHPRDRFTGERRGSAYYWADHFEQHFEYLRNFTFHDLDVLPHDAAMPYRLASAPEVRGWFSTTDVPDVQAFLRLVNRASIDALEAQGGVCILSTHLGKGFVQEGRVDPQVEEMLAYVAAKSGWFVPVSELLDYMRAERGHDAPLGRAALTRLELSFLWSEMTARLRSR